MSRPGTCGAVIGSLTWPWRPSTRTPRYRRRRGRPRLAPSAPALSQPARASSAAASSTATTVSRCGARSCERSHRSCEKTAWRPPTSRVATSWPSCGAGLRFRHRRWQGQPCRVDVLGKRRPFDPDKLLDIVDGQDARQQDFELPRGGPHHTRHVIDQIRRLRAERSGRGHALSVRAGGVVVLYVGVRIRQRPTTSASTSPVRFEPWRTTLSRRRSFSASKRRGRCDVPGTCSDAYFPGHGEHGRRVARHGR